MLTLKNLVSDLQMQQVELIVGGGGRSKGGSRMSSKSMSKSRHMGGNGNNGNNGNHGNGNNGKGGRGR